MSSLLKPKKEPKLNQWASESDFQQIVLIASAIGTMNACMKLVEPGSERRKTYAEVKKMLLRLNNNIPGALPEQLATEKSDRFYKDLDKAIVRFMNSFNEKPTLGRDPKTGKFCKIEENE